MLPDPPPLPIETWPLAYEERLDTRPLTAIEGVVIHCTETPDLASAREFGERPLYPSGTGNSGHYYVDRDGRVLRFVEPGRVAHHVRGHNAASIGIELVNRGRYPNWLARDNQRMDEAYNDAQIISLINLLQQLREELPNLRWIAGHEDLDTEQVPASDDPSVLVPRKLDPGPGFPWARLLEVVPLERKLAGGES